MTCTLGAEIERFAMNNYNISRTFPRWRGEAIGYAPSRSIGRPDIHIAVSRLHSPRKRTALRLSVERARTAHRAPPEPAVECKSVCAIEVNGARLRITQFPILPAICNIRSNCMCIVSTMRAARSPPHRTRRHRSNPLSRIPSVAGRTQTRERNADKCTRDGERGGSGRKREANSKRKKYSMYSCAERSMYARTHNNNYYFKRKQ